MRTSNRFMLTLVSATLALLQVSIPAAAGSRAPVVTVTRLAGGLDNPRGLKVGPDGDLYVAEGGLGGEHSTEGQCTQVIPPIGPYTGSQDGARISKIDSRGVRTTVVDGLPSSQTQPMPGPLVSGVADIAFVGKTLYAILAGAGCSHGVEGIPNGVIRVNRDHTWTLIADLSAFQQSHPVKNPEPDDFEPDGTWYSMIAVRGDLYAVEPNHGEIDRITTKGQITRVIDISASQGHVVPTALAYHGNFYVGNLGPFDPTAVGSSKIWKVTPSGAIKVDERGFDLVLGLAFDARGRMYVLEMSAGNQVPVPLTGRVTRVSPSGQREIIADDFMFPTGLTIGPDGTLYVSDFGFGGGPGDGSVWKIEVVN